MESKFSRHWAVVAVLCGISAASLGLCVNCSGIFFTPVSTALGIGRGSYAMTATIATFLSALSSIAVPHVVKRSNLKRCLLFGTVFSAGSTILMSAAQKLWQFYLLSAARGIGVGFLAMVMVTIIINRWFHTKNGLATSITMSFSGVCGAIGSPLFSALISSQGWRFSYFVMGIVNILLCLPALLLPFTLDPADCGLAPYGGETSDWKQNEPLSKGGKGSVSICTVILLMLMAFLTSGLTSFTQHLPAVSEMYGYAASVGALTLSFALIGNIIFKLVIGILADRFGASAAYLTTLFLNLAGTALLLLVHMPAVSLAAAFLFGSAYAAASVGMALQTRSHVGGERYPSVYPIVNLAGSTGAALILSVIGYIYDFCGSYIPAILTILGMNILILLLFLCLNRFKLRKSVTNRN